MFYSTDECNFSNLFLIAKYLCWFQSFTTNKNSQLRMQVALLYFCSTATGRFLTVRLLPQYFCILISTVVLKDCISLCSYVPSHLRPHPGCYQTLLVVSTICEASFLVLICNFFNFESVDAILNACWPLLFPLWDLSVHALCAFFNWVTSFSYW